MRLADSPDPAVAGALKAIRARLDPLLPEPLRAATLSCKAIAVLANTAGVTCVLNGMRRPAYVDDSLGALRAPAFAVGADLYRAMGPI